MNLKARIERIEKSLPPVCAECGADLQAQSRFDIKFRPRIERVISEWTATTSISREDIERHFHEYRPNFARVLGLAHWSPRDG